MTTKQNLDEQFPANSHKEKKDIQKVVKGTVKRRKKPISKRIAQNLTDETTTKNSLFDYIIYDVVIPAAKNTISDLVTGGINMLLFGDKGGTRTTRSRGRSYVSYDKYSTSRARTARPTARRSISYNKRARHDFDEIILETRGEAESVLSRLVDLVDQYGVATVADFYRLVDITGEFTDNNYGWEALGNSYVSRVSGGYLINLPQPIYID